MHDHYHTSNHRGLWLGLAFLLATAMAAQLSATETALTIEDVRQRAATFNRRYLSAQQDLEQAKTQVTSARSGVFPDINLSGSYARNFTIPKLFVSFGGETQELQTAFENNFGYTLSVRQSIWEGGKVLTAWQIAKLYRTYTESNLKAVEDQVRYSADLLFYGAILQRSVLETLRKAHEAAAYNLGVVEKLHGQGMVSDYELLRARVEKANLEPQILQAESDLELAEKRVRSFIGMPLRDSIILIEDAMDTTLGELPALDNLLEIGLANRPEMRSSQTLTGITKKAIGIAKADYWPSLDASYTYDTRSSSDDWELDNNVSKTSQFGLSLNFKIFDGFNRSSQVAYRRADHEKSKIALAQMEDDIRLEIEQAYDQVVRAKKSLDIQKETIAQADEGLKIANLRYQQGVGTQLEVLSAQAALTDARRSLAQALYFFRTAKAELRKATTIDIGAETR